jgi:hypothetical protein
MYTFPGLTSQLVAPGLWQTLGYQKKAATFAVLNKNISYSRHNGIKKL